MLGKRQIGELEPSELVVTIVISEVAALPIQDVSQPLISSLIAIFLLVVLEVIVSFSAYKSFKVRRILFGTPSVFYEKGKINQREMEKQRFNLNDLMECVRNTGATSLSEVDFVLMETNGNVSVIPNAQNRSVNISDLNLKSSPTLLSYVIVDNGHINHNNLKRLGFDENWLQKQLELQDIKDSDSVFCMTATQDGETVIIPCDKEKKRK
ncbi:MAG: DUF421 domain-containing protein [Clostridia bacterium]|nr:DUF421 domain-containing protein [Clostridia bacterium]